MSYLQFLEYISAPHLAWTILLIVPIIDIVLPFFLGLFVDRFSHLYLPMSALGEDVSPVHAVYNRWLAFAGLLLLFAAPQIYYAYNAADSGIAMAAAVCVAVYAAGACLLAGIFPVGEGSRPETAGEWVHGIGSAAGFVTLLAACLLLSMLQFQSDETAAAVVSLIGFAAGAVCFTLFVLSDKDRFAGTSVEWAGLWQRLALLAMYIPVIVTASAHL